MNRCLDPLNVLLAVLAVLLFALYYFWGLRRHDIYLLLIGVLALVYFIWRIAQHSRGR